MNRWTGKAASLEEWLTQLRNQPEIMDNVTHWHTIPPREARTAQLPGDLNPLLAAALAKRGINRLFTHQKDAYEAVRDGRHVVAVTPTASGKTLCYNLPVLQSLLDDNS